MNLNEFQDLSNNYKNGEERGKLKNFLSSPEVFPNKITIVISTPSETGTSYFRLLEPIFAIIRNYPEEFNIVYTENITPDHFSVADIIIMHRADMKHSKLIEVAKKWPKTKKRPLIIHDVDDNEFNLAKNHSMRELWYSFEKDKHSIYAITNSDYIFTTGKGLQNAFRKYNTKISIFRNYFNWRLPQWNRWDLREKNQNEVYKDKIVLGYCGLSSHQDDIRKLSRIWKVLHDKYPNTHFIVSGVVKVDILYNLKKDENGKISAEEQKITDPSQTYKARIMKYFEDFDPNRVEFQDSKNLEDYGEFYTQYDINCVYIEKNTFNECKSDIKLIEGLHYENIPVFSNWGPYGDFFYHLPQDLKNDYIKVDSEDQNKWVEKLEYWINNLQEGKDYVKKLKKYSDELSDVDLHISERVKKIKELIDHHNEEEILKTSKYINF